MKKSLIFGILLFFSILLINFVIAEDLCSSNDYECGTWQDSNQEINCGSCTNGACVTGRCYPFDDLGKCISLSEKYGGMEFVCESIKFISDADSEQYKYDKCQEIGCNYNPKNPLECEGTPISCLTLKEDCLTGLDNYCIWENSAIYSKRIFWEGKGIVTNKRLVISVDRGVIENIADEGIPVSLFLEYSGFPEGTNLNFEIYKIASKKEEGEDILIGEEKDASGNTISKSYGIGIPITVVKGIVNKERVAKADWIISEEDLATMRYDGNDILSFIVKKNGEFIYSSEGSINEFGTVKSVQVEEYGLQLLTKKGECSGIIPCEDFSMKWDCEESAEIEGIIHCNWDEDISSCVGDGISCSAIGEGDICREWGCSWKADNLWERFTDWLKILFRINQ